ncbi:MAG: aminodeoxychorismate synthase component I [Candidatus Hydrogenedentes bacterium]|nr:aminodeoxychorismate synthase component I [Candidatus Hydrogenedentota bacterium]
MLSNEPYAAIFTTPTEAWGFAEPCGSVTAWNHDEIDATFAEAASQTERGLHAMGFVAYDAAPAFDSAFRAHRDPSMPLAHFAFFRARAPLRFAVEAPSTPAAAWTPLIDEAGYLAALAEIRRGIGAGDTYQVNFTFPLEAPFSGDPHAWFHALREAQGGGYCALLSTDTHTILSASPELFFHLRRGRIVTRPMKGTRPRALWPAADRLQRDALRASEKDRAENIMIVDMMRNDLGRICETGSVEAPEQFSIEQYPTVWQMTSTVTGKTRASVPEIFRALFPSASITGAPKVAAMNFIHALERHPRGLYCGAIGYWSPGQEACFNVAIRTLTVDHNRGVARYAVGSGVTWDSAAKSEYLECLDKARILTHRLPAFELLETLRHDGSFFLLEGHIARLLASAAYFQFSFDEATVLCALKNALNLECAAPARVRITLARNGVITAAAVPLAPAGPWRLGLAVYPVSRDHLFLYHKTTHRQCYQDALATRPDCDDVLLWNDDGELTESCIGNLVLQIDGQWRTPPIAAGLLGGVFRAALLEAGEIREARLTVEDLNRATAIRLINSVREWWTPLWVDMPAPAPR